MSSRLIDCLSTTPPLADVFSDAAVVGAMLDFEVALARAAARAGAIPAAAAAAIEAAAVVDRFDPGALARDARESATPAIPFVKALTDVVRADDPDSAQYVHWGATSQDVTDTAIVLLLKQARGIVTADHARVDRALRSLSDAHAATVMLGRTLLQPAAVITFGLKVAGWWAALDRSWRRLSAAWDDVLVVQLGGAAGTRAALGDGASRVVSDVAQSLGLAVAAPWHTDRDRLGAFVAALGLYTAAVGKAAQDVVLLMQAEVAEVAEPGGGSSTMPQKRNPSGCAVARAAAVRLPHLVGAFLAGAAQEHERAVGGIQAEWPTIASAVQACGSAAEAFARVAEGLHVDTVRMRMNVDATRGLVFAEQAVTIIGARLGRDAAKVLVNQAVQRCRESALSFPDVVRGLPEVARALTPEELGAIDRVERALGDAEALRRELLGGTGGS